MRNSCQIVVNARERTTLKKWSKSPMTPMRVVVRAKIALLAATGMETAL
ncbi:MAG: hypothetical protein GX130_01395 [Candidatus Hydrogenedens sp.]|nr:hypothetical protein [Candidatus Hydrogenedens sp.]